MKHLENLPLDSYFYAVVKMVAGSEAAATIDQGAQ
jgi:hypothetical protein